MVFYATAHGSAVREAQGRRWIGSGRDTIPSRALPVNACLSCRAYAASFLRYRPRLLSLQAGVANKSSDPINITGVTWQIVIEHLSSDVLLSFLLAMGTALMRIGRRHSLMRTSLSFALFGSHAFVLLHDLFVFGLFLGPLLRRQQGQYISSRLNGGHP